MRKENDKLDNKYNIDKIVSYWIESSDNDFETMNNLFRSKDYSWSLFIGHLVIEKLLKAYYAKRINKYPPFTHDLRRIAEDANLDLDENQIIFFDTVTRFNIKARYDDYKLEFYNKCTKEFSEHWIQKIKLHRLWIKKMLLK